MARLIYDDNHDRVIPDSEYIVEGLSLLYIKYREQFIVEAKKIGEKDPSYLEGWRAGSRQRIHLNRLGDISGSFETDKQDTDNECDSNDL